MNDDQRTPTQVMHQRLVSAIGYLDVCYSDIFPLSPNGILKTLLEAVEPLYRPPVEMTPEEEKVEDGREKSIERAALDVVKAASTYLWYVDCRSLTRENKERAIMIEEGHLRMALRAFDAAVDR